MKWGCIVCTMSLHSVYCYVYVLYKWGQLITFLRTCLMKYTCKVFFYSWLLVSFFTLFWTVWTITIKRSKCSSAVLIFQSKPVKEKKKKLHIKTQCDLALEWNDQKYGTNKNLFRDVAEKWLCRNMKSFWICMENFIW